MGNRRGRREGRRCGRRPSRSVESSRRLLAVIVVAVVETFVSVLVPFATSHSIVTTSVTFSLATALCRFVGTLQVTPATLIEVGTTAVIAPRAFTCSGRGGLGGWHPPDVIRIASPAAVPPPSLPFAKPPAAL